MPDRRSLPYSRARGHRWRLPTPVPSGTGWRGPSAGAGTRRRARWAGGSSPPATPGTAVRGELRRPGRPIPPGWTARRPRPAAHRSGGQNSGIAPAPAAASSGFSCNDRQRARPPRPRRRRQGRVKDEGPGRVDQVLPQGCGAQHGPALGTQGLGQRGGHGNMRAPQPGLRRGRRRAPGRPRRSHGPHRPAAGVMGGAQTRPRRQGPPRRPGRE